MTADESIGVSWVANNKNLDTLLGIFLKSFSLDFENLDIGSQQVLPVVGSIVFGLIMSPGYLSMPSLLGMAPTRKAASMSVKALLTSSVASTPATRGRAES